MLSFQILATILLVSGSLALYDKAPDVVKLTPDNFHKLVTNSSEVWLVMFYAPWCIWSMKVVPEFTKAACALKGIAKLGAIDADEYHNFSLNFGLAGYPTIHVFAGGKHKIYSYKYERKAKIFVEVVLEAANKQATDNLSYGECKLQGDERLKGDVETTTEDVETTTQDVETTTQDVEITTQDVETTTQDVETTTQDVETTTQDVEITTQDVETTAQDVETTTQDVETTTQDVEITTQDVETTTQDVETTTQDVETTTQDVEITTQDVETTTQDV